MRSELTPLDVNRQTFATRLRGYDRDEVDGFLREVAEELERLRQSLATTERRSQELEAENRDHRERERLLRETLLTAQKAAEEVRDAARRDAEVIVREAELSADRLADRARQRAAEVEGGIQDLRMERKRLQGRLQHALDMFRQALELDVEQAEQDDAVISFHRPGGDRSEGGSSSVLS